MWWAKLQTVEFRKFHITSVFCSRIQSGIPYCVQSTKLEIVTISQSLCLSHPCDFHRVQVDYWMSEVFGFVVPFIFKEGICQCSCHFLIWFWSKPGQRDWAIRRRPDVLFAQAVVLYLWRLLVGVMDFLDAQLLKNPSAMQESLVQYQLRRPSPFTGMILLHVDPLQFYGVSKKSLQQLKQLEIIACLREKSFQGSQPNLGLISARLPLGDSDLGRGAIIMANKSKQYLVITTCQEPCLNAQWSNLFLTVTPWGGWESQTWAVT